MLPDRANRIKQPNGGNISAEAKPDIVHQLTSSTTHVRQTLEDLQIQLHTAQLDPDLSDTAQIILAEVLNNIVEHAYGFEDDHPITLSISLLPDGLWCETFDEGVPMPNGVPPNGVMPKFDLELPSELPEGGFGWAMVRELTEDIQYKRDGFVNHLSFLIPKSKT